MRIEPRQALVPAGALGLTSPTSRSSAHQRIALAALTPMAAVMAALAGAAGALDAPTIAATFQQGQRIRDRVTATLNALVRTGCLSSADGGESFAMRRVA